MSVLLKISESSSGFIGRVRNVLFASSVLLVGGVVHLLSESGLPLLVVVSKLSEMGGLHLLSLGNGGSLSAAHGGSELLLGSGKLFSEVGVDLVEGSGSSLGSEALENRFAPFLEFSEIFSVLGSESLHEFLVLLLVVGGELDAGLLVGSLDLGQFTGEFSFDGLDLILELLLGSSRGLGPFLGDLIDGGLLLGLELLKRVLERTFHLAHLSPDSLVVFLKPLFFHGLPLLREVVLKLFKLGGSLELNFILIGISDDVVSLGFGGCCVSSGEFRVDLLINLSLSLVDLDLDWDLLGALLDLCDDSPLLAACLSCGEGYWLGAVVFGGSLNVTDTLLPVLTEWLWLGSDLLLKGSTGNKGLKLGLGLLVLEEGFNSWYLSKLSEGSLSTWGKSTGLLLEARLDVC